MWPKGDRDALADPFGYSDLRGAAAEQQADSTARPMVGVVLKTLADGTTPDWKATVSAMLEIIAGLTDPVDTAVGGSFKQVTRDLLDAMRKADRDAWSTIEHRLGDRDRRRPGDFSPMTV